MNILRGGYTERWIYRGGGNLISQWFVGSAGRLLLIKGNVGRNISGSKFRNVKESN